MAKTKEELTEIKNRVIELSTVLQSLSEDELSEIFGGFEAKIFGEESCDDNSNIFGDESTTPYEVFMKALFKIGDEQVPDYDLKKPSN